MSLHTFIEAALVR